MWKGQPPARLAHSASGERTENRFEGVFRGFGIKKERLEMELMSAALVNVLAGSLC